MTVRTLLLQRTKGDENQTSGTLSVLDENGWPVLVLVCIERGWRNNEKSVSCVPAGVYPLVHEWSPRFQRRLWELKGVPGRAECKIHAANKWDELNGCIAPGEALANFGTGYLGVTKSKSAMVLLDEALSAMDGVTTIDVRDAA